MTVTADPRDSVASALEVDHVESHLHPVSSFDLDDHPMPTGREEIWRFTPLKRLAGALDDTPGDADALSVETIGDASYVVGTLAPGQAPRGVALVPDDRASALASKHAGDAVHVKVPADAELAEPIGHRVTGTVHVGTHEAVVGRDARYRHISVTFGGSVVRTSANVHYAGPGGEAELLGLYFADAGQHFEHRLFVDHNAPRTKSNVVYKGALQGEKARTVWIGNVLIRKVAEAIETYEENRNLVLTDGCQADSVPNLEIETGEIEGAGHASATARFDDEQLFYLRSRGVSDEEARRLVLHGFFQDLIRKIGLPELEEKLTAAVEDELARNVAGKVL